MASSDVVAKWDVTLSDRVHRVEFEHGTTTGKRVIRVDGNVCELEIYYFTMSFTSQTYYFTMSFSNCITSTSDSVVVGDICRFIIIILFAEELVQVAVQHGMTTRQENCANSCHCLKPIKQRNNEHGIIYSVSVTSKSCSFHNINRSFEFG